MSRIDSRSAPVTASFAPVAASSSASVSADSDSSIASGPVDSFDAAPGIWMPTKEQQGAIYKDCAERAFENGTAKEHKHAPCSKSDLANCPSWDITPKFTMGSHKQLFLVGNELWVRQNIITPSNPTKWFDVGPAPQFMPRDPNAQT